MYQTEYFTNPTVLDHSLMRQAAKSLMANIPRKGKTVRLRRFTKCFQ